jgi:hypothetical protein
VIFDETIAMGPFLLIYMMMLSAKVLKEQHFIFFEIVRVKCPFGYPWRRVPLILEGRVQVEKWSITAPECWPKRDFSKHKPETSRNAQ